MQIGALDAAITIPGNLLLDLHNELSYNPRPVNKILLLCLEAAEQGGENLLGRNADITSYLAPATLHAFEQKGGVRCVSLKVFHMECCEPYFAWQALILHCMYVLCYDKCLDHWDVTVRHTTTCCCTCELPACDFGSALPCCCVYMSSVTTQ